MRRPLKSYSEIYKITCLSNGKIYVGQTRDFQRRQKDYKLEHRTRNGYLFFADMRKYGFDDFKFEIIQRCRIDLASKHEIFWIKKLNSKAPNGYNISAGGNTWAWKNPEETKLKISMANTGKIRDEKFKEQVGKRVRGEGNPKAKLTWGKVALIRESYIFKKTTMKFLAKKFEVSPPTIQKVLSNTTWRTRDKTLKNRYP